MHMMQFFSFLHISGTRIYVVFGSWAVWPLQSVCIFSIRSHVSMASGCPAGCVAVLASLHLFRQQRRRQSSLENVLMINDSGSCAENASAGLTLRGVVFADGWVVGGMIGPDSHVHPCSVFVWLWLWWRVCITSQGTLSGTRVCRASPWWATRFWHVGWESGCRWMDPHQSVKVSYYEFGACCLDFVVA